MRRREKEREKREERRKKRNESSFLRSWFLRNDPSRSGSPRSTIDLWSIDGWLPVERHFFGETNIFLFQQPECEKSRKSMISSLQHSLLETRLIFIESISLPTIAENEYNSTFEMWVIRVKEIGPSAPIIRSFNHSSRNWIRSLIFTKRLERGKKKRRRIFVFIYSF